MPQLSEAEITERGKELAALECQLTEEREKFAAKRKQHVKNATKLEDRIQKLSKEIDDAYAEDVQEGLPGIKAGSGPDDPATLEMARGVGLEPEEEAIGDAERAHYVEEGANAYRTGKLEDSNPYTGSGEAEAIRRAAWSEGFEEAATDPDVEEFDD